MPVNQPPSPIKNEMTARNRFQRTNILIQCTYETSETVQAEMLTIPAKTKIAIIPFIKSHLH